MYISIHFGVRMIQKKKSPRIRKANMYKTCWKEDLKNEPGMDNGNENPRKQSFEETGRRNRGWTTETKISENVTRKVRKIVVRRLQKYTK